MATGGAVAGNIAGLTISGTTLSPLAGSAQPLSAANPQPAQIQFTPDGNVLVVTEKGTNRIVTYLVSAAGYAGAPMAQASAGMTPFGFVFDASKHLLVSEAFGGMDNKSAMSSYTISPNGTLTNVSATVTNGQTASCWVAWVGDNTYTTNTGSASISGYKVAANGALTLMNAGGITAPAGMGPADVDVSDDNQYLYVLNGRDDTISSYRINADGSLTRLSDLTGLPMTGTGLVAR
jgi:6-phosphogluconolactonase